MIPKNSVCQVDIETHYKKFAGCFVIVSEHDGNEAKCTVIVPGDTKSSFSEETLLPVEDLEIIGNPLWIPEELATNGK